MFLQFIVFQEDPRMTRTNCRHLHNWENLWEDDAGFSQVLVQNSLVEVISGVFDLGGLENQSNAVLTGKCGN